MKAKPDVDTKGRGKWLKDDEKQSLAELLDDEIWDELAGKLNFSPEYPKGTQTAARHITYQSHINKLVEEIRCSKKSRFRTDSEVFRVIVHHGVGIVWNVFCRKSDKLNKSRAHFFYEVLQEIEKEMERATMVAEIRGAKIKLLAKVKGKDMTKEDAKKAFDKLMGAVSDEDKKFVKAFFHEEKEDNVTDLNIYLTKSFDSL